MTDLVLATQNKNKVSEIQAILSEVGYNVLRPTEVGVPADFDVDETGTTYTENSELKARAFAEVAHKLVLADDSGLSVEALDGRPGVYSKRYAPGSDQDRNEKLLGEMIGKENRQAAFITDLCLYDPATKEVHHFEGRVDGKIADSIRGNAGFGYDPIFIPDGYDQTFAELGQETKNQLSHRARALAKVKEYLQKK